MVAQEWHGSDLKNSVYFEPDEQGFDLFNTYLLSINNEPIRLLIDLIEEEFRQETIPFVRGPDRKAVIQRNIEKFFRNTSFRQAISLSVNKSKKRKEEKLLFTGLTNPELLEPWLEVIEKTKTPLSGIVSLPLLSESLVKQLAPETRCVILVSQQVPSNLRQSVFVDGKLILSRLVPIASFYQGKYAEDVMRDVDSTQRYLISQRLIDRSESISVHILSNNRHFDKLTIACAENSYFDYEIYNINELLKSRKIEMYDEQDFSSTLFCHEAANTRPKNHYARKKDKRYFKHYLVGLSLKIVGIIIFTVGLGFGMSSAIQGFLYQQNMSELESLQTQYDIQFRQLLEKTKSLPADTKSIQHAVNQAELIKKYYTRSPQEFLTAISQDLLLFADLRVGNLNWFISNDPRLKTKLEVTWGKSKKRKKRLKRGEKRVKPINGYYEILVVEGDFVDFNGNYRYALSVIADFEDLLKESGKYDSVEILKRPLNIDTNTSLQGDASTKNSKTTFDAGFKIKLTKKVIING